MCQDWPVWIGQVYATITMHIPEMGRGEEHARTGGMRPRCVPDLTTEVKVVVEHELERCVAQPLSDCTYARNAGKEACSHAPLSYP